MTFLTIFDPKVGWKRLKMSPKTSDWRSKNLTPLKEHNKEMLKEGSESGSTLFIRGAVLIIEGGYGIAFCAKLYSKWLYF